MGIPNEETKHIADLSKLEFSDEKLEKISIELSNMVDFANVLSEIDVEGVKPTAHILDIKNVFRKDEARASYDREQILKNAPEKESGCVSVPKTVE